MTPDRREVCLRQGCGHHKASHHADHEGARWACLCCGCGCPAYCAVRPPDVAAAPSVPREPESTPAITYGSAWGPWGP